MISFGRDRGDFWLFLLLTPDAWWRPLGVQPHLYKHRLTSHTFYFYFHDLFHRAWCVAEIAEAKRLHMNQALKVTSKATIMQRAHTLENLDIRNMRASSETDKELILKKIQDSMNIDQFNAELRSLIFDPKSGLLASWHAMDTSQQLAEAGRLVRWGLADAGTGKVWKAWEPLE